MSVVTSPDHARKASQLRALLGTYSGAEDLIRIGAYQSGADPQLDRAIAVMPALRAFLAQKPDEAAPLADTIARLLSLPS
jgi:flagellar biosynthesis/type III secretory pathway ATPase